MSDNDIVTTMNTDPVVQELLAAPIPARLAYIGTNGDPRAIPVSYIWNGAAFVFASPVTWAKVEAIRRHPRVALTVDETTFPPRGFMARGTGHGLGRDSPGHSPGIHRRLPSHRWQRPDAAMGSGSPAQHVRNGTDQHYPDVAQGRRFRNAIPWPFVNPILLRATDELSVRRDSVLIGRGNRPRHESGTSEDESCRKRVWTLEQGRSPCHQSSRGRSGRRGAMN
jgi:hypothetical protein